MSGTPALADIIPDAEWLPFRLSGDFASIRFVHIPRAEHPKLRYLEEKFLPAGSQSVDVPVAELAALAPRPEDAAPRFIFHSSMCGSTLLARVLDQPGFSMALAEPIILNQLSARLSRGQDVGDLATLVVGLLSRPFAPGEQVVIKPGNTANNLMPVIADRFPAMRAITLEASPEDLLRAVAKRGSEGRMVYRRLFAFVDRTHRLDTGFSPEDMWELTDLQVAALGWLTQHSEFARMLDARRAQFRSLTMERLLGDRADVLAAIGDHFDAKWSAADVARDERFSRHSKDRGRTYDEQQLRRDSEAIDAAFGTEIEWTAAWVRDLARYLGLPIDLPNALTG